MVAIIAFVTLICILWYLLSHGQKRVAVAFAVAPLAVPLAWVVFTRDLTATVTVLFAYPLVLVPGIPLYFALRRIGWFDVWRVVLASAILAGCVGAAISNHSSHHRVTVAVVAMCSGFGALVGLVFWSIAFAGVRSNNRFERSRAASSVDQGEGR